MKIFLIRHGESTSDVNGKYEGDYDDHLTEAGRESAQDVAEKLKEKGVQVVFSSGKIRAKETSEIIRQNLDCEVRIIEDLNERDIYGAFPELSKDQPEEEYRRLGEVLADRETMIEGVETHEHFLDRITRGFDEIRKGNRDTVAVVTHGGPIRCIIREILKLGELKKVGNGAIIELEVDATGSKIVSMQGVE